MKVQQSKVTKILLSELDRLDPITIYAEDFDKGQGKITITCYDQSWSAYWGGMGDRNIAEFFCSCDEHYIAKNLSDIKSDIFSLDKIQAQAKKRGVGCYRDDPWNDYEFLTEMYGSDPYDWGYQIPTEPNPEYQYLCRIIKAVQDGLLLTQNKTRLYTNNKSGVEYELLHIANCQTNGEEGTSDAVYMGVNSRQIYTRRFNEFKKKFTNKANVT